MATVFAQLVETLACWGDSIDFKAQQMKPYHGYFLDQNLYLFQIHSNKNNL